MLPFNSPPDVFLDTDLVVNAVIHGLQNSESCRLACSRLLTSGSRVFYSQVLRIEYMQAIRRLATKRQLPTYLYDEFELSRWSERDVRERWMFSGFDQLRAFLGAFPMSVELALNDVIVREALGLMGRYSLGSLDAVHLATALHYEIPVFWTCDDHFQWVDDLVVEIIRETP
jgi:predicted nucleic acid-binding protein